MKNLSHIYKFGIILTLVFILSGLIFPEITLGQSQGQCWRIDQIPPQPMSTNITQPQCLRLGPQVEWRGGAQVPSQSQGSVATSSISSTSSECGVTNIKQCVIDTILLIPGYAAIGILKLSSLLTYLSGAILNFVVRYTVVDMKINLEKAGAINLAWSTLRDVANMLFIFILLYAAIKTILGSASETRSLIVRVIVVAILINFSLFFTKIVIDASNILAITFYDAIAPGSLSVNATTGLSDNLMNPLKLQSIFDTAKSGLAGGRLFTIGVMGSIVALIAAFVFFAVSIMFVIRFVVLIFVLILSPLAFMGYVLPELKNKISNKWLDALLGQAFFAPIYFLLTWIVIVVSRGLLTGGGDLASALSGQITADGTVVAPSPTNIGILMNFIIMIALLIASLIISKDWANKAGGAVPGMTKWAMGLAGGASLGVAGRFGRGTMGRAGQALAENEWLKDKAPTSRLARLSLAAGRKTGGASFDVRGIGAIGGQLDAGKAQKGGFAADLKSKLDTEKKYADEAFKPSDLTVMRAERALADAKKSGTPIDVARAQAEVDRVSGANEDVLRQRRLKEYRAQGATKKEAKTRLDREEDTRLQQINTLTRSGVTQEEAEKRATAGWAPKPEKGLANIRKEAYAKNTEEQKVGKIPFGLTTRYAVFGPVKGENILAANAIRKSMKEKKAAEKIADEIGKQSQEAADGAGGAEPTTPTNTAPTTPAGEGAPPTT